MTKKSEEMNLKGNVSVLEYLKKKRNGILELNYFISNDCILNTEVMFQVIRYHEKEKGTVKANERFF